MQTHPVRLSDIESVSRSDLSDRRLADLKRGSLEDAIFKSSDPIAVDKSSKPYRILNGRHRVYLARQKGMQLVPVVFA